MLGVELLAGFDQLVIHDVQIAYGCIQMLMPQGLLNQFQPPSVFPGNYTEAVLYSISGKTKDSYNDVGRTEVEIQKKKLGAFRNGMELTVKPHSVNILQLL